MRLCFVLLYNLVYIWEMNDVDSCPGNICKVYLLLCFFLEPMQTLFLPVMCKQRQWKMPKVGICSYIIVLDLQLENKYRA